ncbi:MAG: o-succinylbenzoate--CoA ligase [Armatimonadota bacterium]|nr:o-succinylbenzoate--CoA ligase [Armatimonadota bacterium]MDR7544022.1 o-succinylbenzoate--CoA ligase [Armatimonadota bacterium]
MSGSRGARPPSWIPDWLRHRATVHPERLALVAVGERLSFADLDRRADRAARRLAASGVGAGVRVAVLARAGAAFAVLAHALPRIGAVMVPLNVRLAPPEITWQVTDSRAAFLLYEDGLADLARTACGDLPGLTCVPIATMDSHTVGDTPVPAAQAEVTGPVPGPLRDWIDLAGLQGIIYTSATSGRPKGVMLSFGNHWWSAIGTGLHLGLSRHDRWLAVLPLFHVGGLAILWRCVIYGIPAIVHEAFDPAAVNQAIDAEGVTLISVVSTMLERMLDERGGRPYPPTLRCVLLGGGPAPGPLVERCLRLGVPVAPTYGLTEAASQVATMLPGEVAARPGAAGKPLPPAEIRIEDEEILVRGPTVMLGYAGRPEETARTLRGGWLHTGDLGHQDADGYLYVHERRDDLIITGGENVYPAEVEAVLLAHPGVEDAGAVGVPDQQWGQVVAVAVKCRPGARLTAGEVRAFCRTRLAGYKTPKHVWFVDNLPRSPAGKLIRRLLREQAPASVEPEAW